MGRKPKTDEETVLNSLEAARTKSGLSRQEIADLVGVHYQTIGYIERGEYSPSLVLALRIAEELKTPVEQLFWLKEEE
jgi:DNA-binding XRE family transcriptional regulator